MPTDTANTTNTPQTHHKHTTNTYNKYIKTNTVDRIRDNITQNSKFIRQDFPQKSNPVSVCKPSKVRQCPADSESACVSGVSVGVSAISKTYGDNVEQLPIKHTSLTDGGLHTGLNINIKPDPKQLNKSIKVKDIKIKLMIPWSYFNDGNLNYSLKMGDVMSLPADRAKDMINKGTALEVQA